MASTNRPAIQVSRLAWLPLGGFADFGQIRIYTCSYLLIVGGGRGIRISKELLEPLRRQGGVAGRVLNVTMPEIRLDRARVVTIVGAVRSRARPGPKRFANSLNKDSARSSDLGSAGKRKAQKASELANRVADHIVDKSMPPEEQERRKRVLIKGPKEFRDIREDLPKPRKG